MKFLRDLFMGVGNTAWDIGRIGGGLAVLAMFAAAGWNISLPLLRGRRGIAHCISDSVFGLCAILGIDPRSSAAQNGSQAATEAGRPQFDRKTE